MSEPVISDTQSAAPDFAAFEASENAKALGHEPPAAPPTPEPDADPDDAEPPPAASEPPAAQSTSAAQTPEKPLSKRQQHINDIERKAKLAEIRADELAAKLAAIEARTQPSAEPAKPKTEEQRALDAADPEPQEANFEDYGQFVRALSRWEVRQDKRDAAAASDREQQATRAQQADTDFRQRVSTWIGRRDAFLAAHPARADRVTAFLDTLRPGTPMGDAIMESEVGGEMADYFEANPQEADRIARLPPISALRALGKLEARFDSTTTSTSASAGPAAKTVTTAPAPPTMLAARSADPADPVAAAVARGDFSAFEAAENRKALAGARR